MTVPSKSNAKPKTTAKAGDDFVVAATEDLNHELFERNMGIFKASSPTIASKMSAIKSLHSRLVVNRDGDYDIDFRGDRLYGMGGLAWAKKRTKNFDTMRGVQRMLLNPPDTKMLDDESNVTVYRMLKRATEDDIQFTDGLSDLHSFHLLVLGIGLAHHLPILSKKTACQHLVLVEPNLEFLYLSMYVFDWEAFLIGLFEEGRHLTIITDQDSRVIAESVRDQMRFINPAFMEGTIFFESYPSSLMARARDILVQERETLTIGLGFLEDEMDMVRNSFHNLKNFKGKYFKKLEDPLSIPAFIVGSGPSLDNDLAFIKENQDRAIIISCGTSLRILLHNDITPDFHMELENVPIVADLMENLSKKFDLSKITLLATTTVDPGVAPFFDNVIFYFRNALASYPLFSQGYSSTLHFATPMVTNLGFSFAQEIGCRTIYNFGIDLGARDPKVHHAKDAPYGAGEVEFKTTINEPVPGNFGGTVFSEMIYLWAKQTMEYAMNRFSAKSIYYNCSDGVRLEGMIPKLSSTVSLQPIADKSSVIGAVMDKFPQYSEELFNRSWYDYEPRKRMQEHRDLYLKICRTGRPQKTDETAKKFKRRYTNAARYPLRYMMHLVRELIPPDPDASTEVHYYRGSTFLCMAAVNYYVMRVPKGPKRRQFLKIVKEEFMEQIRRIDMRIQEFYDTLDPPEPESVENIDNPPKTV